MSLYYWLAAKMPIASSVCFVALSANYFSAIRAINIHRHKITPNQVLKADAASGAA